jgi:membrane protein implicated in regulation of membrane protease activity
MVAIYAIWRWGLPEIGINMHIYGLLTILVLFTVFSIVMFMVGTRTLGRIGLVGLSTMIGTTGKVARIISPKNTEGLVNIKGELWTAESTEDDISPGEKVDVVGEDGMKLVVSRKQVKK